MKLKCLIFATLCSLCIVDAMAQLPPVRRNGNIAIGINRRAGDSTLVSKLDIGLLSNTDTLHGAQLGALTSVVKRDMSGVNIGGLFALSAGEANGLQVCGAINSVGKTMNGVQLSLVSNFSHGLNGFQISGFSNIVTTPVNGVQISGITNIAMGMKRGVQVSLFANICSSYMRGVQASCYNYADTLNGSQLGVINVCVSHPRGVQVGLFNYSRDTVAHKIGLVNINPKTRIDVLGFIGTSSKLNFGLRFRNRSTYSIVGFGTHYMGLDKKFSGALFYRIGQYFNLTPRFSVSSDIGYYHVETFQHDVADKPERLFSLQMRVNADYDIGHYLGAFASVGYGDTRYYHHAKEYRNRAIVEAGLSVRFRR